MLAGPTNIYQCADVITWKIYSSLVLRDRLAGSLVLRDRLAGHGEANEVRADAEARTLARRHAD